MKTLAITTVTTILAIALSGCGGLQGADQPSHSDNQNIGARGKADAFINTGLSCQNQCGDLVYGGGSYCGCDDACDAYGDCCSDKATFCAAPANDLVITWADNGKSKTISLGDSIDVQLAGNPTTGYAWHLLTNSRSFPLQNEEYLPDQPVLTGSGGTYHFYFTADIFAVGNQFKLVFSYHRSWEGPSAALKDFVVYIKVIPSKDVCKQLDKDYVDTVAQSKSCNADSDCQTFVGGNLSCGIPQTAINTAYAKGVLAFNNKWSLNKCHAVDWNCPLLSPLPPWFKTQGVCNQGTCEIEYIDTRNGKEGDACGKDINVECGDGLYCAMGLNWCGTPPVTGICRKMGECGNAKDCYDGNNDWIHPMCIGEASCSANKCGWKCGGPF